MRRSQPGRPARRLTALFALLLVGLMAAPALAVTPGNGNDVSWPQCNGALPASPAFGIVGVTDGKPFTTNPCLSAQWGWASQAPETPGFYVNTDNPVAATGHWGVTATPRPCSGNSAAPSDPAYANANDVGCAYDYGYFAAQDAVQRVDAAGLPVMPVVWWLDVETGNSWRGDAVGLAVNAASVQGFADGLRTRPDRVLQVGIYSNNNLWRQITGQSNGQPVLPSTDGLAAWYPVGTDGATVAAGHCGSTGFDGGAVALVQWVYTDPNARTTFDGDAWCNGPLTGSTVTLTPKVVLPQLTVTVTRTSYRGLDSTRTGCLMRLDGTTSVFAPGQQVIARGRADRQVGYANVRYHSGGFGVWSSTFSVSCKGTTGVKVTASGVSRVTGLRYAFDARTANIPLTPRR